MTEKEIIDRVITGLLANSANGVVIIKEIGAFCNTKLGLTRNQFTDTIKPLMKAGVISEYHKIKVRVSSTYNKVSFKVYLSPDVISFHQKNIDESLKKS